MKKIIFLNQNNHEVMSFNNFVFDDINNIPEFYTACFSFVISRVKIEKKVGGSENDFFILGNKLKQLLNEEMKKFYLFISMDESFQIIFEVKEPEIILVLLEIEDHFSRGDLAFKYEYEMGKEQADLLIAQVEDLYKERTRL
ncbi:hypothetical protein [Dysgonomonas macrotermitis]|uniref:Uncharacterized protein n=1 Tax=Dysgonomonas macrotermitis TaxID=1346286 RepID=A0A1M4W736_9BACT|nr:hypothetical protein [Dysgonomonas macrotermitis]SHE77017.1 hypothetical protein SAMN05444362_102145 [Dysgonomonas macrotermitis]